MHLARLTTAVVAAALLVSGCTRGSATAPDPTASTSSPPVIGRYVALGDSFSAGPLIPTTDLAGGCARSDHNYPHLVADAVNARSFVDVTCSGADHPRPDPGAADVRRRPHPAAAARGHRGHRRWSRWASAATTSTCSRPWWAPAPGCAPRTRRARRAPGSSPPGARTSTPPSPRSAPGRGRRCGRSRRKAPSAEVLLVGYLRLAPDRGTCVGLPLAAGDYAEGRRISRALDRALRPAAARPAPRSSTCTPPHGATTSARATRG